MPRITSPPARPGPRPHDAPRPANLRPEAGRRPPGSGNEDERPLGQEPPREKNGGLGEAGDIEAQIEKAENARSAKEAKFSQMKERMEKIVEYLKTQDVDTTEAENNSSTFEEKAASVLGAYDAYIAALEDSRDTNDGKFTDAASEAREKIRELSADLRKFFRDTLLASLRSQIDKLAE
jgi:hypothetical protein